MKQLKVVTKFAVLLLFVVTASLGISIRGQAAAKFETITTKGVKTSNAGLTGYEGNWASTVSSYLYRNVDGTYNRVEHKGKYLYSETYTASFKYKSRKKIKLELPAWGGVYIADDNYFVLLGKNNTKKKKNMTEFRIIKYDKNWKKLGSKDIMNVNTAIPFDAGSCRFEEMDGELYVRTCHKMYNGHQACVMMRIRMSDLEVLACQSNVANSRYGYISHSFNQFLEMKNGKIYACDHGDAYNRAITMMRFDEKIEGNNFFGNQNKVTVGNAFEFYGETGNNYTGATLGGFAVSDTHCISVGTSTKQTKAGVKKEVQNVYVAAMRDTGGFTEEYYKYYKIIKGTPLGEGKAEFTWITKYSANGKRTVENTKLVDVMDGRYLLIWEESYDDSYDRTCYCFLDETGKKISGIKTVYAQLSDCQPIVVGNRVVWYIADCDSPIFYSLPINGVMPPAAAKNTKFTRGGIVYKVTKSSAKKKEVSVVGYKKSQFPGDITLDAVDYEGYRFKVTAIGKNAFKNYRKFISVEIGADVKKIGAGAFYGCSKMGTILFNRKKYTAKSIGKNAFAKIRFNAFVVVPKKRISAYKKLLKKKGIPSTVYFCF